MEENEEKAVDHEAENEIRPVRKPKKFSKPIQKVLEGDFLSRESVVRNIPFIIFLAVIGMIYIANTYYAEKTFKEIEKTKNELKELRYQYITTKSVLMYESKQIEIASRAQKLGLKMPVAPPYKIFYSDDSLSTKKELE